MSWFFVDDSLSDHPKLGQLPQKDALAAMGLWTLAGAWCRRHLTGGRLTLGQVIRLGGNKRLADALVNAGFWQTTDSGYRFHDWEEWQETPEEVASKRDSWKKKKRAWRENRRTRAVVPQVSTEDNRVDPPERPGGVPGSPSPSPSPSPPTEDPPNPQGSGGMGSVDDLPRPALAGGVYLAEVRDGWAQAYHDARAGAVPRLSGTVLPSAVAFARDVAAAHNVPLREAARRIAEASLALPPGRDRDLALTRLDPFVAKPAPGLASARPPVPKSPSDETFEETIARMEREEAERLEKQRRFGNV